MCFKKNENDVSVSNVSIMKKIIDVKPGSFIRVGYETELPLKSDYRNQGYTVIKHCEFTTRLGIKYANMKSVQERAVNKEKKATSRKSNMHWLIEKYILQNVRTGELYLSCYPCCRGRNEHIYYTLKTTYSEVNYDKSEDIKEYVVNSYFNKGINNYCCIKLNNISRIGDTVFE